MTDENVREPLEGMEETTTSIVYSYDENGNKRTYEVLSVGRNVEILRVQER